LHSVGQFSLGDFKVGSKPSDVFSAKIIKAFGGFVYKHNILLFDI